jgi:DNA-binding transcriptional ArsR family regulator
VLQNRSVLNFSALSDRTRQRIVEMLAKRDLSSGEIADSFEISAPAVSQHLNVLKQAGIVRVSVEAQRRIYHLEPAGLSELEHWLHKIKQFWSGRLDVLKKQLRNDDANPRRNKNDPKTRKNL